MPSPDQIIASMLDDLHDQQQLMQRRLADRQRTRVARLRLLCLIPAVLGLGLLLPEIVAPTPVPWRVFVGMLGLVPLLSTWMVRL